MVRYLKVGDLTAPTFTMMGKAEIHDFFRFAESNGTTTTEPGTGRTVGLVGGVGDNGPLYDSNYTYAAYDFTDPGVYAEDDNVLWALSEGNVDLDGDGLGEGYAIIAVADRSQMETCANGPGIIHVYSALEANGSTLKDLQDAMFAGTYGSVSPSKVPDVLGQDSNATGGPYAYGDASQTDLANFDMAVLTIEYRVKDRWENLSSIMTRQLYVYESRKYAGTAIYAQPLTNAANAPFEFYYDDGTQRPALSSVRKDTDGDGASDFWEAALGTDRMDPNATPDLTSPSTFQNLSGLSTPDLTTRLNALPGSSLLKAATGISGFGAVQALP